jgi:hypothetical protein
MDAWEKAKNISVIASSAVIPIVLALVGYWFSAGLKEREAQGKFVEMAVAILKEPANEETRPLRAWATQVIDRYSGVPLSPKTKEQLIEKLRLPPEIGWESKPFFGIKDLSGFYASAEVRSMLSELGYDVGSANLFDLDNAKKTLEAVRQFQRDRHLAADGTVDARTTNELLKAVAEKRSKARATK